MSSGVQTQVVRERRGEVYALKEKKEGNNQKINVYKPTYTEEIKVNSTLVQISIECRPKKSNGQGNPYRPTPSQKHSQKTTIQVKKRSFNC